MMFPAVKATPAKKLHKKSTISTSIHRLH